MRRCLRDLETAEPQDESESRTGAEDEDAADVCQITIDVRRGGVPVRAFTQPHSRERRAPHTVPWPSNDLADPRGRAGPLPEGLKEDPHRFLQERNKRGHPPC